MNPASTSATNPLIFERMAAILTATKAIGKDRKNTQQGYSFRGIDDVYNELHETFATNQVFILPTVLEESRQERPTKSGGILNYTIMRIQFRFQTVDGSFVDCVTTGEGSDSGDKSTNKAMSTALKYALFQVFLIPTEGDNDTENHSPEFVQKTTVTKPTGNLKQTPSLAKQTAAEVNKKSGPVVTTADQVPATDDLISDEWKLAIAELKKVDDFNTFWEQNKPSLVAEQADSHDTKVFKKALMNLFHNTAKRKGYAFDTTARIYVLAEMQPA